MKTLLLGFVAKVLFLPILIFAVALLVKGYTSTGGGFAAGAVAGIAILLQRVVFGSDAAHGILSRRQRRAALALGLGVPLSVTLAPLFTGGSAFLRHLPHPGDELIHLGGLELHTSLVFDAGIGILVLAFVLEAVRLVAPSGEDEEEE